MISSADTERCVGWHRRSCEAHSRALGATRRRCVRGRSCDTSEMPSEPDAVGWDAITGTLERLYPDVEPIHRAPIPGPALGGGVQGISAYPARDHWHLVTYGLTELYDKESDDVGRSGWGYELTIWVAPLSSEPPTWAYNLLERIAQQTQQSGTVFESDTGSMRDRPSTALSHRSPPLRSPSIPSFERSTPRMAASTSFNSSGSPRKS